MKKTFIGLIGCGKICSNYFECIEKFDHLQITACADINPAASKEKALEYNIPKACPVEELLDDPGIGIVLNLTIPAAHAEVSKAALLKGKHVYCEKPLALNRHDGRELLALAAQNGLRIGCAPDTFLGSGLQTCRSLIDSGTIGKPHAATAFMAGPGPESWHPNPSFYYQKGGGPLFDMGPYYFTALAFLLGPATRVTAISQISLPERVATCEEQYGLRIKVETPTHYGGLIEFECGALITAMFSFDAMGRTTHPHMEIYGSKGTLICPNPNNFDDPVLLKTTTDEEWQNIEHTHNHFSGRGIGLADMAHAIQENRPHRANGHLAYHILDIMQGFDESSQNRQPMEIQSACLKPEPMPSDFSDEDWLLPKPEPEKASEVDSSEKA